MLSMANKIGNTEQYKTNGQTSKLHVFAKQTTYTNAIVKRVARIWKRGGLF